MWWEGLTKSPAHADRLAGQRLDAGRRQRPARRPPRQLPLHRPASQCPSVDKPGKTRRRADLRLHLRRPPRHHRAAGLPEAFNWNYGVLAAATLGSETTAAASAQQGVVRRDPFAMLPFCGYHMGDYFNHWLKMGKTVDANSEDLLVNWFRTERKGEFMWPGFGDNMRVLKWIVQRCKGTVTAKVETVLGWMPNFGTSTGPA